MWKDLNVLDTSTRSAFARNQTSGYTASVKPYKIAEKYELTILEEKNRLGGLF